MSNLPSQVAAVAAMQNEGKIYVQVLFFKLLSQVSFDNIPK